MMTREQKQEWLAKATNAEVLEQLRRAVVWMTAGDTTWARIQGQEDYDLAVAEITKRMEA